MTFLSPSPPPGSPLIEPQVCSSDFFSLSSCVLSSCYPFARQHKCWALIFPGARSDRYHHKGVLSRLIGARPCKLRESCKPCHLRILHPTVRNLTRSQCFLQPPRRPFQISVLRETRIFDFHGHVGGNDIFHAMCQIVELSCESRYIASSRRKHT